MHCEIRHYKPTLLQLVQNDIIQDRFFSLPSTTHGFEIKDFFSLKKDGKVIMYQVQKIKFRVRFFREHNISLPSSFWLGECIFVSKDQRVSQGWGLYWLNEGNVLIRLSSSKRQWFTSALNSECLFFQSFKKLCLMHCYMPFLMGKKAVFHSYKLELFLLLNTQQDNILNGVGKGKIRSLPARTWNLQIIADFG